MKNDLIIEKKNTDLVWHTILSDSKGFDIVLRFLDMLSAGLSNDYVNLYVNFTLWMQ